MTLRPRFDYIANGLRFVGMFLTISCCLQSNATQIFYTNIKTTSVGDRRLSVVGAVDTRYGVSQPGADAER